MMPRDKRVIFNKRMAVVWISAKEEDVMTVKGIGSPLHWTARNLNMNDRLHRFELRNLVQTLDERESCDASPYLSTGYSRKSGTLAGHFFCSGVFVGHVADGRRSFTDVWESIMAHFPTTAWNIIDSLKGGQRASLDSRNCFVQSYWPAVFGYLLRRGFEQSTAEDLTQDFFCHLLEKELVGRYEADRGRFRTFVLTILTRFVSDQTTSRAPRQRQFERGFVSISDLAATRGVEFPSGDLSAEDEFMRQWARSVIQATRDEVRQWCEGQGRPDWYAVFEALNPPDFSPAGRKEKIAQTLGLTIDQVRYAQTKTEQKFIEFLRLVVLEQVESSDQIDDEIRTLRSFL
ncbi:hypothetical protein C5Y97_30595 [Blastopirellula marina]|uniref:RNA polymerase sigma-70 region 2 domain-containing protein n=2 Tax=Blastopirellula marina TaxID=124 RepID=A0A2S8F302_9BACT|nr:hypothetical protein C5Y98_30580 [Blastopirellula marina]PTL40800.1 hypothetical protein C5Y97_30595 [Blastopirellula marina]